MKKESGFTLIEIMIAMAILTVGVFGLTSMFETSIRANTNSRNLTVATRLVAKHMEELRGIAFETAANRLMTFDNYTNQSALPFGNPTTLFSEYKESVGTLKSPTFDVTVKKHADTPAEYIDKIVVTVTWTDRFGEHSSSGVTYLANL